MFLQVGIFTKLLCFVETLPEITKSLLRPKRINKTASEVVGVLYPYRTKLSAGAAANGTKHNEHITVYR